MKSAHPDIQLFDYLNGAVDAESGRAIEAHISDCGECAAAVALIHMLKEAASEWSSEGRSRDSNLKPRASVEHPDVSDLASFFFAGAAEEERERVAAHVALCFSCAQEISQYLSSEKAASRYRPTAAVQEMPAKAWEMIDDWEGTDFPIFKPASEVLGQDLLVRLSQLLSAQEIERDAADYKGDRVPVLIVSSSGDVHSVEYFERIVDSGGTTILRHAEGSERFNNKPVHVLIDDAGENESVIISDFIRLDTIRLQQPARTEGRAQRTNYFIIEESND